VVKIQKKPFRLYFFLLLIFVFCVVIVYSIYYVNKRPENEIEALFVVEEGMNAREIALKLEEGGFINDHRLFLTLCKLKGLDDEIKVGTYRLSSNMTVLEIVDTLTKGWVYTIEVTIPEGMRLTQIADILSDAGVVDEERFLSITGDTGNWTKLPDEATSLEGYLFPDTYRFTPGMDEEMVINIMIDRFFEVYEKEIAPLKSNELSLHQIVTLASIIEKEAMLDEERPIISSVFHNRLTSGMKLQSCATVLYGMDKLDERITIEDLKNDNPYNTYIYLGLPPGPICSPGLHSLKAAIIPADTDYLYFVSLGDGGHHFSKSFSEHEKYRLEKEMND